MPSKKAATKKAPAKKKAAPKKTAPRKSTSSSSTGGGGNSQPKPKASVFFYWLKNKTFVAEGVRWDAGFYRVSGLIHRLEGQPMKDVEKFEGEVPEVKVYDMARHFLIKTEGDDGKLRKADELLDEMTIVMDVPTDSEEEV